LDILLPKGEDVLKYQTIPWHKWTWVTCKKWEDSWL